MTSLFGFYCSSVQFVPKAIEIMLHSVEPYPGRLDGSIFCITMLSYYDIRDMTQKFQELLVRLEVPPQLRQTLELNAILYIIQHSLMSRTF